MYKPILIIADDHKVVRLGTAILIREVFPHAEIKESEDLAGTLKLLAEQPADLVLLDLNMPGVQEFSCIEEINRVRPATKILVFSSCSESIYAQKYLKAGANGYLSKNNDEQEIKNAIRLVLTKGRYVSAHLTHLLLENVEPRNTGASSLLNFLSNREIQVGILLTRGMGILEIANRLDISMSTVSTYKARLFEKLKVQNLAELIVLFQGSYSQHSASMEEKISF